MRTYTKACRHGTFLLLHGDMISEFVNLYGEWCEAEVSLYALLLTPQSHVLEVGANIGTHTVPLARICHQGQVLCLEPQRIVFQVLNANLALNNLLNVHTRQQAAGRASSTLNLPCGDYSAAWNYGAFSIASGYSSETPYTGSVRHESVEQTALDSLPEMHAWHRLDLLKIDAEGAEAEVLAGAAVSIAKYQPAIFIENNSAATGDALISALQRMHYACYWFCSSRYRKSNFNQAFWAIPGHDVNMLCLPKGRALPTGATLVPATRFAELSEGGVPIYK